ncbi:MAG: YlbF family regulator [Verrucomicrobiota bacterium]
MIQPIIDQQAINEKTRELCQLLLSQPAFQDMRDDIHAFIDDDDAQEKYRQVAAQGRELEVRQIQGEQIPADVVAEFEKIRYDFLENPVARKFIEAQSAMNGVQEQINKYISKSFELGRVPNEEDLKCEEGGCGSGCGCAS